MTATIPQEDVRLVSPPLDGDIKTQAYQRNSIQKHCKPPEDCKYAITQKSLNIKLNKLFSDLQIVHQLDDSKKPGILTICSVDTTMTTLDIHSIKSDAIMTPTSSTPSAVQSLPSMRRDLSISMPDLASLRYYEPCEDFSLRRIAELRNLRDLYDRYYPQEDIENPGIIVVDFNEETDDLPDEFYAIFGGPERTT